MQSVEDELKSQENAAEAMGTALITIVGLYKKTDGGLEFKEQYLSAKPKNQKTDSDSLDQWLDSDYKLTKEEKKKAKDMLDDYFAEGTTARKLLDENNPNYVMVLRNSMSNAELEQYQKMIALRNKTGFLSSITAGILGGTFLGSLQDMLTEYLSKPEGYTFLDTSKSSSLYANSLSQHKLGTLAGAFAANVALWELGSEALGGIWKTLKGGGKVAEGTIESGSKAAENVIESAGKGAEGGSKAVDITNDVLDSARTGSAVKTDQYHAFNDIIDNYAGQATKTSLGNANLYQLEGSLNGVTGRFEWIVQNGNVTHRMFVPGGTMNGAPIKP